jgi:hypothetical protein
MYLRRKDLVTAILSIRSLVEILFTDTVVGAAAAAQRVRSVLLHEVLSYDEVAPTI